MKDLKTVIEFTMKEMIRRKSFIISTLIILVMIVIGFNIPNIIKSFEGESTKEKLLIFDSENVFEGTLENLKNMDLEYEIEIKNTEFNYDEIKDKINNEELDSAILIEKAENINIKYYVKNAYMME